MDLGLLASFENPGISSTMFWINGFESNEKYQHAKMFNIGKCYFQIQILPIRHIPIYYDSKLLAPVVYFAKLF